MTGQFDMESTIFAGIALHALGGIAAATCYISQKGAPKWSWQTYWIVVCLTAWLLMPLVVSALAVPNLMQVLRDAPMDVTLKIFLLGVVYGFGGMAFAVAIRYIGFSLTYAIAIGISAVFGTLVPAVLSGTLLENFQKPGGFVVLAGFIISIVGVAACGRAGFMKEAELGKRKHDDAADSKFDMKKGLGLVILSGILSGIFGVAVASGTDIDTLAASHGAREGFAGYPKYIFITGGTLLTNLLWWGIVCVRRKTLGEFIRLEDGIGTLTVYYLMGLIAGVLWFGQFVFYEQGHARMGDFMFISWGIHMAMLVFFSFGVGLVFKEWNTCSRKTLAMLAAGLFILIGSFSLITYGSYVGEAAAAASGLPSETSLNH
jgi:L-rhamnose-H+ transport protein